jgi:hypothetical protein
VLHYWDGRVLVGTGDQDKTIWPTILTGYGVQIVAQLAI